MKSNERILEFVTDMIGHIYFRPLMYGGDSSGVDLILHYYHELWAEIVDLREHYEEVRIKFNLEEGIGASDFSSSFIKNHPEATDKETVTYVVHQWMEISKILNIAIDYSGLSKTLNMALP
jgi:hypothetical protein